MKGLGITVVVPLVIVLINVSSSYGAKQRHPPVLRYYFIDIDSKTNNLLVINSRTNKFQYRHNRSEIVNLNEEKVLAEIDFAFANRLYTANFVLFKKGNGVPIMDAPDGIYSDDLILPAITGTITEQSTWFYRTTELIYDHKKIIIKRKLIKEHFKIYEEQDKSHLLAEFYHELKWKYSRYRLNIYSNDHIDLIYFLCGVVCYQQTMLKLD